jgi:protein involved in polysaccharide export with SLBB domain
LQEIGEANHETDNRENLTHHMDFYPINTGIGYRECGEVVGHGLYYSFPLIGDVIAEGKTVAQLRKELEGRISRFVPAPVLSVLVQQVNSMLIYVVGKVNNPGRFILNSNIKVLQGLALAGGLNPFAERNKKRRCYRRPLTRVFLNPEITLFYNLSKCGTINNP